MVNIGEFNILETCETLECRTNAWTGGGDSRKKYRTRCHRTWPAEKEKEIYRAVRLRSCNVGSSRRTTRRFWMWEGERESWVPPLFFIGPWDICRNKRGLKNSAYAEKRGAVELESKWGVCACGHVGLRSILPTLDTLHHPLSPNPPFTITKATSLPSARWKCAKLTASN